MEEWREISEYLMPRMGRFIASDRNRGGRRHNSILDSAGTRARRVLSAGMMAGMTSPARPWFRLAPTDPALMDSGPVKLWLDDVTNLMRQVFNQSNTYRSLHTVYDELGGFGTGVSIIQDHYDDVIRHTTLTAGQYALATNDDDEVDTLAREWDMTVAQMVKAFGRDRCSIAVQRMYDAGQLDAWVTVVHVIEPREDRDVRKRDAANMRFASVYLELGANEDRFLRESGYREFPVLAPRWATSGGDVYGTGPGMEALGDVKQLQHEQLRKAQGIDFMTKPAMQAPSGYKGQESEFMPGGISYVDAASPQGGLRPAFEARIDLSHLLADIQDVRQRINAAFYADLFLMLANATDSRMTATEVAERHEEKLLMLGPTLERLNNELLKPKIDLTFSRMVQAGMLPPAPPELNGQDLQVEYVSMLAQAQKAIGINSVNRLIGTVGSMAQFKPDVLDKLDADAIVDAVGDYLGTDPDLIVASDKVAIVRQSRAEQQQAMQQAAMMAQGAATAKTLADTTTEGKNALTDVTRAFSGYT